MPTMPVPPTIRSADRQFAIQLTESDLLWAARSCAGEVLPAGHPDKGETDEADVLWTLTQRAIRWLDVGKNVSFKSNITGFSQPVSPEWANPDSAKCRANPDRCTQEKVAKRQMLRSATWDDLVALDRVNGTNVVESVRAWANAELYNTVPGVTNFAVPSVAKNYLEDPKNSRSKLLFERGGHWYISDPPATRWPVDYVLIYSADGRRALGVKSKALQQGLVAMRAFWETFTMQSIFDDWG